MILKDKNIFIQWKTLSKLDCLDLSQNHTKSLKSIFNTPISTIKKLYVNDNELKNCKVIKNLPNLKVLSARNNCIKNTKKLSNATSLEELDLSNNKDIILDKNDLAKTLKVFICNNSNLKKIVFLSEHRSLTKVELSNNELKSVDAISQLRQNNPELKTLNIDNNKFTYREIGTLKMNRISEEKKEIENLIEKKTIEMENSYRRAYTSDESFNNALMLKEEIKSLVYAKQDLEKKIQKLKSKLDRN